MSREHIDRTGLDAPTPPGWRRSQTPTTVAILGWARLSYQGGQGSGYNLSASELATGLALSGHTVLYLASGRRYNLFPRMHIARTERWRGVECFDLFNSPNLSPASYNFRNMPAERSHPAQGSLVLRWLDQHAVRIVHIHSLEGFPLDLIARIRATGRPVVVTPHNYWYGCPQVDLMRGETSLCRDYDGGRACESCIRGVSPPAGRWKRRLGQSYEWFVGPEFANIARQSAKFLPARFAELLGRRPPIIPSARDPDPESALGFETSLPGVPSPADFTVDHRLRPERTDNVRRPVAPVEHDENERFLASRDRHLTVLSPYGQRRVDGIAALQSASLVTPPSAFVGDAYAAMGLDPAKVRVVRLGQPHFDVIHRRAKRSPYYDSVPWDPSAPRPLRFGFFGAMRPSKGIDVFAAAIGLLPPDIRRRCQFHFRASGFDWPLRKKLTRFPEVSFSGQYDLYQLIGAWGDYDIGVLPHAWFENSPLVLLEHLHAGKFVLCSRLGGPVEWVRDGLNGLLVTGGRPAELAAAIERLVRGQVPLPTPRQIHERTPNLQSWPGHVAEVESIYAELLAGKTAQPAAPTVETVRQREPAPAGV